MYPRQVCHSVGLRRRRSSLQNRGLRIEVLDCGDKHLRIARELLQHTQTIRQRHHSHGTALSMLDYIFQHLRSCVRLVCKTRIRAIQKEHQLELRSQARSLDDWKVRPAEI